MGRKNIMPLLLTHPKMIWRGRPNTPGGFHAVGRMESRDIYEGTLKAVTFSPLHFFCPARLEFVMGYEGDTYSTLAYFDDEDFSRTLCETLARHTGRPMFEIWGLPIDD
jgi:hypothetical protein